MFEKANVQQTAIDKNAPEVFSMNNWKKGGIEAMLEFPFTGTPGFKVEIPDNTDELFFLKRFYVVDFIQANGQIFARDNSQ